MSEGPARYGAPAPALVGSPASGSGAAMERSVATRESYQEIVPSWDVSTCRACPSPNNTSSTCW
jgi:hypothetical protein